MTATYVLAAVCGLFITACLVAAACELGGAAWL